MKILHLIKSFCVIPFLLYSYCFAQELSSQEKEKIIAQLYTIETDTTDYFNTSRYAAIEVTEHKIYEAEPALIANIWRQKDPDGFLFFLRALHMLKSSQTHQLTLAALDTLDSRHEDVRCKSDLNQILFDFNDFSKRQNTYDYLVEYDHLCDRMSLFSVIIILENYSKDEIAAKEELIGFAKNCKSEYDRWFAISSFYDIYGEQVLPFIIERAEKDVDWGNRNAIIMEILHQYKRPEILEFYRRRIYEENNDQIKYLIAQELLGKYGTTKDYVIVKNVFPTIIDSLHKSFFEFDLDYFTPPMDSTTAIKTLIDTTIAYNNQCFNLAWLGDANFSLQLNTLLTEASTKLNSGDSLGAAIKIKQYQSLINEEYKDSLDNDGKLVTSDGYKFLYYYPKYILERLPKLPTVKFENSQGNLLPGGSLQYYEGGWKNATDNGDGTFTVGTKLQTISLQMTYEYGSQTKSNINVGADTIVFQTVNALVKLQDSSGNAIDTGKVQYYAGGWRNFGSTINGTASKELLAANYTFRMGYRYASNDKTQDLNKNTTIVFQTVNTNVELRNSLGNLIDAGTAQYYSSGWREFGTTINGIVSKELLPNNYTFRMSYAFASNDKAQNIGITSTVVFQTVNTNVELRNSLGNLIDQGTAQYYSGGWREFGTTVNGVSNKELLPNNYTFRMSYGFASNDKAQNIGTNSTVVFQTINTNVELRNSTGNFIDQGAVQYYSGGWREFGTTTNGVANKELLPNNYTFRMSYGFASNDKAQNIGANSTVVFQTVNTNVELRNSINNLIDQGIVRYYSGGWREFGSTANGIATKELLPNNYTFRITHEFISNDKAQNIGTNSTVTFPTVLCTIRVKDSQNQTINNAQTSYYSGGWRQIGPTVNGEITKELLPANLTFRVNHNGSQTDKVQNLSINNIVDFVLGQ